MDGGVNYDDALLDCVWSSQFFLIASSFSPQRYDQRNQPLEKQNAHPNKQIPLIPNPSERLQPLFILLDESVNNNPYQPIPDQPIRYQVSFTQQRYTLNTTQRQLHQHKHENNDIIVNPETHRKVLGYENVVG